MNWDGQAHTTVIKQIRQGTYCVHREPCPALCGDRNGEETQRGGTCTAVDGSLFCVADTSATL